MKSWQRSMASDMYVTWGSVVAVAVMAMAGEAFINKSHLFIYLLIGADIVVSLVTQVTP
jgi:hypothetical protein